MVVRYQRGRPRTRARRAMKRLPVMGLVNRSARSWDRLGRRVREVARRVAKDRGVVVRCVGVEGEVGG